MSIIRIRGDRLNYVPQATEVTGASVLNDMSDVYITSPADSQILYYNSGTGDWENASVEYVLPEIDGGTY